MVFSRGGLVCYYLIKSIIIRTGLVTQLLETACWFVEISGKIIQIVKRLSVSIIG